MPRVARNNMRGLSFFHVMTQGIKKEKIYSSDREKREYIRLIKRYMFECQVAVIAYCMMGNHAHLLVYVDDIKKLTKYMHKLNTSYAIFYNRIHNRVGYVYRDRFKVQITRNRSHMYNCIIYIHNNPVKAKMCKTAKAYKFSSYNTFMSDETPRFARELFANNRVYERAHNKISLYDYFIEENESIELNAKNEVKEFMELHSLSVDDLKNDKNSLFVIANHLRMAYNLSCRKIAEYIGVSKDRVFRVLK